MSDPMFAVKEGTRNRAGKVYQNVGADQHDAASCASGREAAELAKL